MNRPALASVLLLGVALATAGCSGGQSSTASATSSAPAGTQSYASMVGLYSAVLGTGTKCSDVTIEPSTTAKSQASCALGSGGRLVLQIWRDAAGRTAGGTAAATALEAGNQPYCVLEGVGDKGLWSVDGSGSATVCTDLSHRLGGRVTSSTGKG